MTNEKTTEQRYLELIEIVPKTIREEFERIEKGEIVPQMYYDRGEKKYWIQTFMRIDCQGYWN